MRFLIMDERNPAPSSPASTARARTPAPSGKCCRWKSGSASTASTSTPETNAARATHGRSQCYEVLNGVIERRQSVIGLLMGSMSHDLAYQFIKLGRNLERADMTTPHRRRQFRRAPARGCRRRRDRARAPVDEHAERAVRLSDVPPARRRPRRGPGRGQLPLRDPHFPRTVAHCLGEIESCLSVLVNYQVPLQIARRTWRRLEAMNLDDVSPAPLHDHLDQIQVDLGELHDRHLAPVLLVAPESADAGTAHGAVTATVLPPTG